MEECEFCGKEFRGTHELHLHWKQEHQDQINQRQEEKAEEAEKKEEKKKKEERTRKKDLAFKGLISITALFLAVLIIPQILESRQSTHEELAEREEFPLEDQPMMGDKNAKVTLVEFGDYYCPACKSFHQTVLPRLKEKYIEPGKAKLYFLDFPLKIHRPQALEASMAAQCIYSQDQESFWNYHNTLFERQKEFKYSKDNLVGLAKNSTKGLDYDKLETCLDLENKKDVVMKDYRTGVNSSIPGTPTIYVNGIRAEDFSYKTIKSLIENELRNETQKN